MSVLFVDYKRMSSKWNKSWETLLAMPIIESWSGKFEEEIVSGTLSRNDYPVTLVVVHDQGDKWAKLLTASKKALVHNISPPFHLKVAAGRLDGSILPGGWGCLSGRAFPSDKDLSYLAPKFRELAGKLNCLWKRDPGSINTKELTRVWSDWNHDATINSPSPPVTGQSNRSPVQPPVQFSHVLVGFAIVTRAWLCQKEGSATVPVQLADEVGKPVWWWSALGLATDESTAVSLADDVCKKLGEKRDKLKNIPDELIRQESQATCDKIISLIKGAMNGSIRAVDADAALTALEKHLEIIINA